MPTPEQPPEVLGRFCHGDLDAFEALFRGYQNEVYRWIVRIVCDPAAAEDLTVETFWRIYRAHARFDPRRAFGPWARRIATNAVPGVEIRGGISESNVGNCVSAVVIGRAGGYGADFCSTSCFRASMTSGRGLGPRSPLVRWRTETVPASASLGPRTSM